MDCLMIVFFIGSLNPGVGIRSNPLAGGFSFPSVGGFLTLIIILEKRFLPTLIFRLSITSLTYIAYSSLLITSCVSWSLSSLSSLCSMM